MEDPVAKSAKDRKQKQTTGKEAQGKDRKRASELGAGSSFDETGGFGDSAAPSPAQSERSNLSDNTSKPLDALDDSSNEGMKRCQIVDVLGWPILTVSFF